MAYHLQEASLERNDAFNNHNLNDAYESHQLGGKSRPTYHEYYNHGLRRDQANINDNNYNPKHYLDLK